MRGQADKASNMNQIKFNQNNSKLHTHDVLYRCIKKWPLQLYKVLKK